MPKGSTRGVFAVNKDGKVLVAEPGGPAATLEAVKNIVGADGAEAEEEDKEESETAATEEAKPTNGEAAAEEKDEEEKKEDDEEKKAE